MSHASPPPEDALLPLLDALRRFDGAPPAQGAVQVSSAQATLLTAVATSQGASLQAIARALELAPPTVSATVSRLEDAGLLERRPDVHDGRAVRLYLSARGEAVQRRLAAARRERAARLLSALEPEERQALVDLLGRVLTQGGSGTRGTPSPGSRGIAGLMRRVRSMLSRAA